MSDSNPRFDISSDETSGQWPTSAERIQWLTGVERLGYRAQRAELSPRTLRRIRDGLDRYNVDRARTPLYGDEPPRVEPEPATFLGNRIAASDLLWASPQIDPHWVPNECESANYQPLTRERIAQAMGVDVDDVAWMPSQSA